MASIAHLRLTAIVKSFDFDGLLAFIAGRHSVIIADGDVIDVLEYLGTGFTDAFHGEHYLDCRLRRKLHLMGAFDRMFGEPEPFCEHIVWNVIHWNWEVGFPDEWHGPRYEYKPDIDHGPRFVRSRLPKTPLYIEPINRTAKRVGPSSDDEK